jgi:hypothetical protein
LQPAWHFDRPALVPKIALDLANDRRRRKGGEFQPTLRLETLDCLEQADVSDLNDIFERLATIGEFLGEKDDQIVEEFY